MVAMEMEEPMDNEDVGLVSNVLDMFKEYEVVKKMISNIPCDSKIFLSSEKGFEDFKTILDLYQEQPHLLDPHLENLLDQLISLIRSESLEVDAKALAFKYLWLLIKVRGYKTIVKKMPHEVKDLLPVLKLLEDPVFGGDFYASYILLMWISIIIYMPFNMMGFDTTMKVNIESVEHASITVVDRVLNSIKLHLKSSQGSREMAAYLASRFVTRPDLRDKYLEEFIEYCFESLAIEDPHYIFNKMGILRALGLIFKHGKREELLPYSFSVFSRLMKTNIHGSNDLPLRKLSIKLIQRLGLTFVKPKVAHWRYNRGSRSLSMNISGKESSNLKNVDEDLFGTDNEDEEDIPSEIEDVIDRLLQGLKDSDTVVRWSSAKGIGRVTSRLPREFADEVLEAILDFFTSRQSDKAWHGGCLALAELARRGLLLPERLPQVLPILQRALVYDELRGQCSVGANIRDAACYLCWAFARAYNPDQILPFVNELAQGLLIVALFDREIPCRRAGSAAFQEHVGRQGTFPHGIEILTTVDYFAVGNRTNAFTKLSIEVCKHAEYTNALIDHLIEKKVGHWDSVVRDLSAKALHNLSLLAPDYVGNTILPLLVKDTTGNVLIKRHGSITALGYILHALSVKALESEKDAMYYVDSSILDCVYSIVSTLEERKLYRGMGGEYMKQATCVLIQKCALAHLPLENKPKVLAEWHDLMEKCMIHVDETIRSASLEALKCLWMEYYTVSNPEEIAWRDDLLGRYLPGLTGENEAHSLGYASALGHFPRHLLVGKLDVVIDGLITATCITPSTTNWAQTRKEAIKSLIRLKETVGIEADAKECDSFCSKNICKVYFALLSCMDDYTMDRRGDIGAWVREASMNALQSLTFSTLEKNCACISEQIVSEMMTLICQQCVERIDRTRKVAGSAFNALLHSTVPNIPCKSELVEVFPRDWCSDTNWASESVTFDKFVNLLDLDPYRNRITLGLSYSLGGVSANLSRYACNALQRYLNDRAGKPDLQIKFIHAVLNIFDKNCKKDRVILPLIKSLADLLSSCCALDKVFETDTTLLPRLLSSLKKENLRCTDYYKLSATITTLCELLRIESETSTPILTQLAIFLGYQYPKVRTHTASCILTALQDYSDERTIVPEENLEEISTLLEETKWMESLEEARMQRNTFCTLAKIPVPQAKKKN